MKRLRAALALLLAAPFGAAMAADMPLKAPVPIVVEYNWSGLYFGANAGWSRDEFDWRYTNPAPATCCAPFSASVDTGIAGVQSGIQYQWNHIVVGIEAAGDAFARERWALGSTCIVPNSFTTGCQIRHNGFLTAGGRLGWAWGDWLLYGSGGWAITNMQTRLTSLVTGFQFDHTGAQHRNGWYAGFGVEHVVYKGGWADLIAGAEYQHLDFGSALELSPLDGFASCPPGVNCRSVSATEDIVRVRLSVKINHPWGLFP
jgi:opacity protein-like surface antigen